MKLIYKVAEASKVIENSQRDINIAFMNELFSYINKMALTPKHSLKPLEPNGTS